MSVQVENLEKNMAKLTIEVSAEDLEKALESAYQKQKKQISVPGFRKGKVPRAMIEKMYGVDVFYEDAANALMQQNYAAAVDESGIDIVSRPTVDVVQIEKGKPFIFTAEVAVKPEVTLGKYMGVTVTKIDTSVSDEEVDEALEKERNNNARTINVTDRPVAQGDTAVIDFEGFVDGVAFEGGKGENHSLEIGSHTFIDTFEDQLVGKNVGDEVDVNVTFPEQYQAADLAGKPATFKVKINEIKAKELPELDDEFAKDVSEFDTLAEYDKEILKKTRTKIVTVEDISEMDEDFYGRIEALYDPARVLIEWNGMWPQDQLQLPDTWELFQQITIIDGSTFELYLSNMKPLLALLVKRSELVIMNRCDEVSDENITRYRRGLKALNPQAELIFEDAEGEIEQEVLEEDLPYDMKADVIKIDPKDYGIWYIDAMDKQDRYEGKVVEFTGMVLKSPEFPKNYFVPGRMAMTCCEADMTFLGFICKAREARNLETKQWVKVRAKIAYEFWPDYDGVGPVLYAESVESAQEIKDIVQF